MEAGLGIYQIAIIGGALMAFAMAAVFMLAPGNNQKAVHERAKKLIGKYSKEEELKQQILSSLKKKEKDAKVSSAIKGLPSISKLREKLDKTGRDISLKQYLLWCICTAIVFFILFKFIIGTGYIVAALLGVFMGIAGPHWRIGRLEAKRLKKFITLLPDAIDLIVRGLRSGLPVTESVNVIATEIQEPIKTVFQNIGQSVRIGISFEDALMREAQRLQINEFNFFVISIALQRETGGNLAEILENLSETIRARAMMKLKIKAITSEARSSAYIIGGLAFLLTVVLKFVSTGYIDPLFDTVNGNIMAGIAAFLFCLGMGTMLRMAKFQI